MNTRAARYFMRRGTRCSRPASGSSPGTAEAAEQDALFARLLIGSLIRGRLPVDSEPIVRLFSGATGSVYAFTAEGWLQVLELAREYGWQPQGTSLPPQQERARWAAESLPAP